MQYEVNFGRVGKATRVVPGPAFRLAVLGDFSGRANAGLLETGSELAARKPRKVDVDNLDTLIERLGLSVSVPVNEDGDVIPVPIRSMDDFHPDQLVENIPVLEELLGLRRNLQSRTGFDRAAKQVLSWAGEKALPRPSRRARGAAIATDRKLSDFARLTGRKPAAEADQDDLIRRLVGPFIVPGRDPRQDALIAQVDAALSDAMRRVLHHPDFQTAEALWRGLEFLVRTIETGARMQIVLYDVSAEELAADLAASDALEETGLFSLLVEQPAQDASQGPLSMIAGLYQFEATPPHADLLGRIAGVAAAAGAAFVTGIGPDALRTPIHEWNPLSKQAWDALRDLPASAYLALLTPRFLLRMPYGKKTDPIDAFAFEEFTRQGGLSGMLWGHPALLFANRIAATWRRDGKAMKIGSLATIGDLPVYVYHDTDGEQIALPCTERLFTERQAAQIAATGVNPVVALRGRPEVRIGGFASMAGGMLSGPWAPFVAAPPPADAASDGAEAESESTATSGDDEDAVSATSSETESSDSDTDTDTDSNSDPDAETGSEAASESGSEDLDALLSSLGDDTPASGDGADVDLDALLASLK
jgi:type VI secretion system protein ImpC